VTLNSEECSKHTDRFVSLAVVHPLFEARFQPYRNTRRRR